MSATTTAVAAEPFERTAEQFERFMARIKALLLAKRGHCLIASATFFALWGEERVCCGAALANGDLDWESLCEPAAEAWTEDWKDCIERALARPSWHPYPPDTPSVYPRGPIEQLEALGCCVVVFGPKELRGLHPEVLQDLLLGKGMDAIDDLAPIKPLC